MNWRGRDFDLLGQHVTGHLFIPKSICAQYEYYFACFSICVHIYYVVVEYSLYCW